MIRIKQRVQWTTAAQIAVNHENIFLAKTPDSESTTRAIGALGDSHVYQMRVDRSTRESQKHLRHSRFLRS
jgi:hypothetical protein